jgi:hypothetical protein
VWRSLRAVAGGPVSHRARSPEKLPRASLPKAALLPSIEPSSAPLRPNTHPKPPSWLLCTPSSAARSDRTSYVAPTRPVAQNSTQLLLARPELHTRPTSATAGSVEEESANLRLDGDAGDGRTLTGAMTARDRDPQHDFRRRLPRHWRQQEDRADDPAHQREKQGGGELRKVRPPTTFLCHCMARTRAIGGLRLTTA